MTPSLNRRSGKKSGKGFALIAILLMAALLTVIVVAFAGILRIETNNSGNTERRSQARQNALLGLDLAMGELQKNLGPDQRISASAGFLDSDAATETIEGVSQPRWTGSWNAYQWTGQAAATVPSYDKAGTFRRWLVSIPEDGSINPQDVNLPKNPSLTGSSAITLVGKGSVLPKNPADNVDVRVWKVDADRDPAGFQGRYAWWVGDEGVKAKINHAAPGRVPGTGTLPVKDAIDLQQALASSPRNALEAVQAYENLKAEDDSAYAKAVSFLSLPLVYKNAGATGDFSKAFHDYTVHSLGVLADVQNGGLKKDLNLLLELPKASLPAFVRDPVSNATASKQFKKVYFKNNGAEEMGPDWGSVYRYYNLYKSPYLEFSGGTFGFYMDGYNADLADIAQDGSRDFILPQTLRIQYLFGFFQAAPRNYEAQYVPAPSGGVPTSPVVYIAAYPALHLWNPYNISLRSSTAAERAARVPPSGGTMAAQIWSFPSPPLSLSFDGGGSWRPFIGANATESIFQSYGGSMCTTWVMSGNFFQLKMDPGTVRLFGINNFTTQQMYWQDQKNPVSGAIQNPNRAFDLTNGWTSSNVPPNSNFLRNSGDHHLPAGGPVNFRVKWNLTGLGKNALGRALFYEGSPIQRLPGIAEINTLNMKTATVPDETVTYRTLESPGDIPAVSPSSFPSAPNMAFSYNINFKAYSKDFVRKSKFSLFSDPTEKNHLLLGADAMAAQMAPFEATLQPIQGNATGTISNYPGGTKAVQIDSTGKQGYFGDQADGVKSHVAVEFPLLPMSSLVQLQNVALGRDHTHPMYNVSDFFSGVSDATLKWDAFGATFFRAMGNSYAHPAIASDALAGSGVFVRSFDHSFYANNTFWDSYYFSGITPQQSLAYSTAGASSVRTVTKVLQDFLSNDPSVYKPLPSGRLVPWIPSTNVADDLINDLLDTPSAPVIKREAYARAASWLMVDGAFNVNSTSVDAWTSVLSGTLGQQVPYIETTLPTTSAGVSTAQIKKVDTVLDQIPFLRMSLPNNLAAQPATPQTLWNGYRSLALADVRALAAKLVEQVKKRGPFLSMAEFVNRQVSSDNNLNQSGALQSAIDEAGLNSNLSTPSISAAEAAAFPNKIAAMGPVGAGSPTFLTQGDVLKPVAGILSARSDTFTIRAYGEVTSPAGSIVSRAWCEAVVQRTPEYVDQNDPVLVQTHPEVGVNPGDATPVSSLTNGSLNKVLGRRFRIVHFRWLNSDEV